MLCKGLNASSLLGTRHSYPPSGQDARLLILSQDYVLPIGKVASRESLQATLNYLANGEIGIAVGLWKTKSSPKMLKVEFSSQKGYMYDFYANDFREEGDAALELAYALTVHKAQGSQF